MSNIYTILIVLGVINLWVGPIYLLVKSSRRRGAKERAEATRRAAFEQTKQAAIAEARANQASRRAAAISAFVAKTPEERKSIRKNGEVWFGIFFVGIGMFFFWPTIAVVCLPITLGAFIIHGFVKQEPPGAPSEEEILRASGTSEEVILQTKILHELENF